MDLYSLFKFLQCTPFSDLDVFNKHVTKQWKSNSDPDCVARLKNLVSCLSLRRPKTTIKLLPRNDTTVELEFNDQELQQYQRVKNSTLTRIDGVVNGIDSAGFFNALSWVNQLRLLCNHGLASHTTIEAAPRSTTMPKSNWTREVAQSRFDHLDAVGLARCSNPSCDQDLSSALSSDNNQDHDDEPFLDETLTLLCFACKHERTEASHSFAKVCNHFPRAFSGDHIVDGQIDHDFMNGIVVEQSWLSSNSPQPLPTKIRRVIQDLVDTPDNIKRSVQFLLNQRCY